MKYDNLVNRGLQLIVTGALATSCQVTDRGVPKIIPDQPGRIQDPPFSEIYEGLEAVTQPSAIFRYPNGDNGELIIKCFPERYPVIILPANLVDRSRLRTPLPSPGLIIHPPVENASSGGIIPEAVLAGCTPRLEQTLTGIVSKYQIKDSFFTQVPIRPGYKTTLRETEWGPTSYREFIPRIAHK